MGKVFTDHIQAARFGKYYLGHEPNEMAIDLYVRAMAANPEKPTPTDERLMDFVFAHPWSLGFIDAGLALFRPHAELRRRLFIMFALLESIPEYTDYFLPEERSGLYIFVVMWCGIRAACRAACGALLIKAIS
jgi:hypothetical protein